MLEAAVWRHHTPLRQAKVSQSSPSPGGWIHTLPSLWEKVRAAALVHGRSNAPRDSVSPAQSSVSHALAWAWTIWSLRSAHVMLLASVKPFGAGRPACIRSFRQLESVSFRISSAFASNACLQFKEPSYAAPTQRWSSPACPQASQAASCDIFAYANGARTASALAMYFSASIGLSTSKAAQETLSEQMGKSMPVGELHE